MADCERHCFQDTDHHNNGARDAAAEAPAATFTSFNSSDIPIRGEIHDCHDNVNNTSNGVLCGKRKTSEKAQSVGSYGAAGWIWRLN